ncbi:MAG: hypothetical protein IH856_04670 [Deltaproteobacteria bacterium]|nr:hypothetical protein [Deltaproteobacteria bacterium]
MVIFVHTTPPGVDKVCFEAESDLVEELCLGVWPLVRKELNRLHKRLRKTAGQAHGLAEEEGLL